MTTRNAYWSCLRLFVLIAVALVVMLAIRKARADEPDVTVVHVLATDAWASEFLQDAATFTVYRSGPTNEPLAVHYRLEGTASNGVDYEALSGVVVFEPSASTALVRVEPFEDSLVEGNETVALILEAPIVDIFPPPYVVGWPGEAISYIEDNDFPPTNQPPAVRIANPPDGSVFESPLDLRLIAHATDADGRVLTVEFFDGDRSLGIVSNRPPIIRPVPLAEDAFELSLETDPLLYPDLGVILDPTIIRPSVFVLSWPNVPPGHHVLTAVATDNLGASTRSAPVEIKVTEPPAQAVVNVCATDPVAAEPGPGRTRLDTATFTVSRTGPTDLPLTVYYRLGGDARNGVDYRELPFSVVIPRGASSADVLIEPLDDNLVEGPESVVLTVVPPICIAIHPPPPDCYRVGRRDSARAVINDNDPANLPPVVEIVRPLDGSVYLAPVDIAIVAQARDFDGRVVTVEFFEGTNSLGIVSNRPSLLTANTPQFALKWPDVKPGHYILTAEATDDDGARSQSRPVEIKVVERTLPPIVSVEATDPEAAEVSLGGAPNTATFTFRRTGPTDRALVVFYSVGGTAENGVDYREIGTRVIIPSGSPTAPVVVEPIDDRLVEGTESVSVTIEPPILLSASILPIEYYVIGSNSQARAFIRDNDVALSNQPPKVALIHPNNGDVFAAPADIALVAEAKDADGFVRTVEFFEGDRSLGVVSNSIGTAANILPMPEQFFRLLWANVRAGSYVLTAKATDNRGAMSVSDPIRIRVIEDSRQPVVTIEATDPFASEGDWILEPVALTDGNVAFIGPPIIDRPNIAVFTVKRDRGTNIPLTVYFSLGGTAENGVDYRRLDRSVVIPAGAWHANIVVYPIDDLLVEGTETVVATLEPIACIAIYPPPPDCYLVGEPAKAIAYIRDNDFENRPPRAEITKPASGEIFLSPADIEVVARVSDPDGYVNTVEFFDGTNSIGSETRVYIIAPPPGEIHTFSIVWSNAPVGVHTLTAVATDEQGLSSRSDPVRIEVRRPDGHPVVNLYARDDTGSEIPVVPPWLGMPQRADPAIFTFTRTGPMDSPLPVFYGVGGTASFGVDYSFGEVNSDRSRLRSVLIPAGASSVDLYVWVIDDFEVEGTETVELALMPPVWPCFYSDPPCLLPNPPFYVIGPSNHAEARILDNDLTPPPVVTVVASDPDAAEEGLDPGRFTFSRTGDTSDSLGVFYSVGGTAEEGVDYLPLFEPDGFFRAVAGLHFVEIPAGAASADVVVTPIDDRLAEGRETVVVQLRPQPWWPVVVGARNNAAVTIADNDRPDNLPPNVEITRPASGEIFLSPADIEVVARVSDPDGYVTTVEFFDGTNSIGSETRVYIIAPPPGEIHTFSIIWSNAPVGVHALSAVATDEQGLSSRSEPVRIEVRRPGPRQVTIRATDPWASEGWLIDPIPIDPILPIELATAANAGLEPVDPIRPIPIGPNNAVFTVSRNCCTNEDWVVRYKLDGTAENGVDYQGLSGVVRIIRGNWSAPIIVQPIDDRLYEGTETVECSLVPPCDNTLDPAWPYPCYEVGDPGKALAWIRDNDLPDNLPPKVAIVKPETGDQFRKGADIPIVVQAVDEDGWVGRMEFFADGRSIGVQEIYFIVPPPPGQLQRFSMVWSNAPVGRHVLTAVGTDDQGLKGQSGPVVIEVIESPVIPVVNIVATDALAREGAPPNTAAFRIRRSGETNAPLTVHFAILGTADNGVDYVEIPSSVTIPAGRRAAGVIITPIDDRRVERIETVILRLHPAALYNVGRWGCAGAVILDNDHPRPGPICLPDRTFLCRHDGVDGQCYRLEFSSNLVDWEALDPNIVVDGAIHFLDCEAPDVKARFYRVRPVPAVEMFSEE